MKIPRIVIGGTHSGVGKTSVAIGIMGVLARRGRRVQGFKIGPDFLDTSFHTTVTGRPSRNLDSWMIPKRKIPSLFASGCQGTDIAVIEGVMGVFDGIDGKSEMASTSQVAKMLNAPVLLVIDAYGLAGSAAALVLGYKSLDPDLKLNGVILNRVAGDTHAEMCRDAITHHSKIPVLGAIPVNQDIKLHERHLGLIPATEMENKKVLEAIIDLVESHVDLDHVEDLADSASQLPVSETRSVRHEMELDRTMIAVARDRAFSFYYQENLDRLAEAGARLKFFSPLKDGAVPEDASGLYIGGGYPEVYASALAENHNMLESISKSAEDGMPVYGECGGFMYLTKSIQDLDGVEHKTVGLLEAKTSMVKRLTLSYTLARSTRTNILTPVGKIVRGHEYHFSAMKDVPRDTRFAYELKKGIGVGDGHDGWTCYNTLASYMHTNFASDGRMAERFVESCVNYSKTVAELAMRIASLLPSATEIAFALGLGDQVVAVSHECDYPPGTSKLPVLTKSAIHQKIHNSLEVDRQVERRGGDIYEIDEKLLEELKPDLILTQELCAVCAVSYTKVKEAARVLDADPRILSLEPSNLEDIVDNVLLVGKITGKLSRAQELASQLLSRIEGVKEKTRNIERRPRVFFMEWLQPPWAGGHWIPQMVNYAGGIEGLGRLGKPSHRIEWDEVLAYQPEIIVLSPCGFDLNGVLGKVHLLASYPGWKKIPAFNSSRIYAVNASAYFSRPGPRVVDGLEQLARIIHPELFPENPYTQDVRQVDQDLIKA